MRSFLPLLLIPVVSAFECWSCGVFLNAPSDACKGSPRNVTCPNADLGCVKITAENQDGSYYVEKNCVQPEDVDFKEEGCRDYAVRGRVGSACVCKTKLCNASPVAYRTSLMVATSLVLALNIEFAFPHP
ncbi:hypothetical protein PRIPAC_76204 [Pristionchus pacificus]|uniref:Uncharacterized protein n=1 Tax=Pristionchus pacificus TaxID=54126 RepID=A0A2A6C1M4_PRIPA|nr:hypothetical protein PRIPAC_76204 [Pristionchus pacificus]|eukprot:PDM72008.1 hypothetical protein PRIPAC_38415 [Pristionchus pacificus]